MESTWGGIGTVPHEWVEIPFSSRPPRRIGMHYGRDNLWPSSPGLKPVCVGKKKCIPLGCRIIAFRLLDPWRLKLTSAEYFPEDMAKIQDGTGG